MNRINTASPYRAPGIRAAALAVVLFAVVGPQPAAAGPVALTYAEAAAGMRAEALGWAEWNESHHDEAGALRWWDSLRSAHPTRLVFEYDAFGRRAVKRVYGREEGDWALRDTVKFVYAGWLLIAELDADDNLLRSYTWGRDLSGGLQGAGGIGGLMAVRDHAAGRTLWPVYDDRGNVTALVDAAEHTVLATIEYGPYGELLAVDAAPGAGIDRTNLAALCPLLFSTKYLDAELLPSGGLVYYGYRYYEPTAGKWLNRDPIAEAGGLNLYGFVGNDPGNAVDPWGLIERWDQPNLLIGGGVEVTADGHVLYNPNSPNAGPRNMQVELEIYDFNTWGRLPRGLKWQRQQLEIRREQLEIQLALQREQLANRRNQITQVQKALEALCDSPSFTGSREQCRADARRIAEAYVHMYHDKATWNWRERLPLPNRWQHYRQGWMCYHWQTHTHNALEPIVRESEFFDIRRVGYVEHRSGLQPSTGPGPSFSVPNMPESFSLQHNWVAISTVRPPRGIPGKRTAAKIVPPGESTLYLDPWSGGGPVVYPSDGPDTPVTHNFLGTRPFTQGGHQNQPIGGSGIYLPDPSATDGEFGGWYWPWYAEGQ